MAKLVVGNWKMIGDAHLASQLPREVAKVAVQHKAQVVLCPPAVLLFEVASALQAVPVALGAQDCHQQKQGAHTGDISAAMLKEIGCQYVIVGHSERRAAYGESDELVATKAAAAIESGLTPIICVGETLKQREAGQAIEVVSRQVEASLPVLCAAGNFVLAYEPVWAIGSGKIPAMEDIAQMHEAIVEVAARHTSVARGQISVLYGGSVKPDNAEAVMAIPGVAGVLVGGASVKAQDFCQIIEAAH